MTNSTGIGRGNNPRSWGHHKSGAEHHRWVWVVEFVRLNDARLAPPNV